LLVYGSVPAVLIGTGTVGYRLIEGWPWFYSFYVSTITLTSIGYGERNPLSDGGRLFTLILAVGGIFMFAIAVTELLSIVITGELRDVWDRWRMRRRLAALRQHVIVCGYGHVGEHVCAGLLRAGASVVVVDRLDAPLTAAAKGGAYSLQGDATTDDTLTRAGIQRARALISVAGSDADNVLITMTARLLRPELPIVARAEDAATLPKLQRAGATRTVSPHALAGDRMAQAVMYPAVLDLLEDPAADGHVELRMEEHVVLPGSPLDGQTVGTSGLRSGSGPILVAIKRRDGRVAFNPQDETAVAAGDTLITLGSPEQLRHADALALSR
jgi:voltage-gated potassium channel